MRKVKLVKLTDHDYAYFIDGMLIKKGVFTLVKMYMEADGYHGLDFALKCMNDNNHDVADFGINGGFIITESFEKADIGFNNLKEA